MVDGYLGRWWGAVCELGPEVKRVVVLADGPWAYHTRFLVGVSVLRHDDLMEISVC